MKSSTYLLWLKRLSPLAVAVMLWYGYALYDANQKRSQANERELFALATAKVWIATAKYRDQPKRFLEYRDSLLGEMELSPEKMFEYIEKSEGDPQRMLLFTQDVKRLVDSLANIELSVIVADTSGRSTSAIPKTR